MLPWMIFLGVLVRLVANRKHLEMSKSDRTWAICVDGLGGADGSLPDGLVADGGHRYLKVLWKLPFNMV